MMRFASFSVPRTCVAAGLAMAIWPLPAWLDSPGCFSTQDPFGSVQVRHDGSDEGRQASVMDGDSRESSTETVVTAIARSPGDSIRPIMTSDDLDRKLQQPVDFAFDQVPFLEVMDQLRDQYGLNLLLDQSAKDDSLTEDAPVSCRLENVRLSTALRMLLRNSNATYMVDDGILRIISLDVVDDREFLRRKVFDCRQLLDRIRVTEKDRIGMPISVQSLPADGLRGGRSGGGVFSRPSTLQTGGGGLGGGTGAGHLHDDSEAEILASGVISQIVSTRQAEPESVQTDQPAANPFANTVTQTAGQGGQKLLIKRTSAEGMLVSLVKQSVQPDSWEDTHGDASLIIVGGLMVVTQTQQALDDINALARELEERLSRNE